MKRVSYLFVGVLVFTMLISTAIAIAQPYGNEWIVPNQRYFRFSIGKEGMYRLYKDSLDRAGINLGGVSPRKIQIFRKGQEVARFIPNESDGVFSNGEYIEFYAQPNDGSGDRVMYRKPEFQANPYVAVYQDSATYFLTWSLGAAFGKQMPEYGINDISSPLLTTMSKEELYTSTAQFSLGKGYFDINGSRIHQSYFDIGEGWTGPAELRAQFVNFTTIENLASGGTATMEVCISGRNGRPHLTQLSVGPDQNSSTNFLLDTLDFFGYEFRTNTYNIPLNAFLGNRLSLRINPTAGNSSIPDFVSPTFVRLRYPRNLEMNSRSSDLIGFLTPNAGQNYLRVSLRNPNGFARCFDITDPFNVRILRNASLATNEYLLCADNARNGIKFLYSAATTNIKSSEVKVSGIRNVNPTTANYITLFHSRLTQPVTGSANPVRDYVNYRASAQGGDYDTLSFEIRTVYDMFNYGDLSPEAIRRLCDYFLDNGNPKYLFLIGKGIIPLYRLTNNYGNNLIPPYGLPGSDVFYSSELNGAGIGVGLPTGRLSAVNSLEVLEYLNKVKEHEALPYNELWRKNTLSLSGGRTSSELREFREYVEKFARLSEQPILGGKGTFLSKQGNGILEFVNIQNQLNNGLQLISIFGHSSVLGADVEIGKPTDPGINNKGKYPMIMINGCRGGNIYDFVKSLNEEWVLTPNKGAVAFMGTVDEAFPSLLDRYVTHLHNVLFNDSLTFGYSIGRMQQEVSRRYMNMPNLSTFDTILVHQFSIHGDPAVVLYGQKKADYRLQNNSVYVVEPEVNSGTNRFNLGIIVENVGWAPEKELVVGITRTLPNGTRKLLGPFRFPSVKYKDTLFFPIDRENLSVGGLNVFEVKVNYYDSIPESNYFNNTKRFEYYIRESSVVPLFPQKYAIVSSNTVQLVVQSSNPNAADRNYLFELDTNANFSSPLRQTQTVSGRNIARVTVTIPVINNRVWYWRSRFTDQQNPQDTGFARSSFIYINGSPEGWSQSTFKQFEENTLTDIERSWSTRRFQFPRLTASLQVTTSGSLINTYNINLNGVSLTEGAQLSCWTPAGNPANNDGRIITMMVDSKTLKPYLYAYTGDFNRPWLFACGREPSPLNFYSNRENNTLLSTTNGLDSYHHQLIEGNLKTGDYVLMLNVNSLSYSNWGNPVRRVLATVGSDTNQVRALINGEPHIILGQKGIAQGAARQVFPERNSSIPGIQQTINLNATLNGQPESGTIASTRIGPARSWGSCDYSFTKLESTDSVQFNIYGVDINGNDSLLFENVASGVQLAGVNAAEFPYLYLEAKVSDPISKTPPVLNFWRVFYTSVPEGLVVTNLPELTTTIPDKEEGETFSIKMAYQNISALTFTDSLTVRTTIQNTTRNVSSVIDTKLAPLAANATANVEIRNLPTLNFVGENRVTVFVNPRLQPELYFTNNLLEYNYKVNPDKRAPIMDVAFDGVRIMDGDLVAPNPLISVVVRDENRFKLKQDTVGLSLLLTKPGSNVTPERISFSDSRVQFFPATANSPLRVEFKPGNLENGKYRLQVQTSDASGNTSGSLSYAVTFEVINESKISNFYPYPNPFSSSTRFVFTLTGGKIPDNIKIQVLTVSGRVVREITKSELGPIKLGNNISSFAWDGTDEFGDRLANGVYLYRVITEMDGSAMNRFETAADNTFKNGFGKMYIMR